MNQPWGADYVSMEGYLPEDDYERIQARVPDRCPTCGGTGTFDSPTGRGRICDCRGQMALFKHYLAAGIGELYMRLDWADYVSNAGVLDQVVKYLGRWRGYLREGVGLTLQGGYGTGKTMLATLTAKELVKLGQRVYFTTYSEMVEMFAAGWRSVEDQRWFEEKVIGTKVLVIDDIGKEMETKLSESTFDHVMRQRVMALRPTILTTNLKEENIHGRYGGGALSILFERSVKIVVPEEQPDYRLTARLLVADQVKQGWRRPIT